MMSFQFKATTDHNDFMDYLECGYKTIFSVQELFDQRYIKPPFSSVNFEHTDNDLGC
jgi:hypothetical protein